MQIAVRRAPWEVVSRVGSPVLHAPQFQNACLPQIPGRADVVKRSNQCFLLGFIQCQRLTAQLSYEVRSLRSLAYDRYTTTSKATSLYRAI
jgi:hypothetical protein